MPAAGQADPKVRTGSRHKPRRTISFSLGMYDAIKQLARQNRRPVAWEARIAICNALVAADLMTQEEADAIEMDN